MTDPELLRKKLVRIETCVAELRRLADPSRLEEDVVLERFVEHTLQIAVQTAIDVAAHVVSDERLGEPRTMRDLFVLLHRANWLDQHLAENLQAMCGLRNVLVHGYEEVDLAIVRDVLERHLGDHLAFVKAVRGRIAP